MQIISSPISDEASGNAVRLHTLAATSASRNGALHDGFDEPPRPARRVVIRRVLPPGDGTPTLLAVRPSAGSSRATNAPLHSATFPASSNSGAACAVTGCQ
jgi:hypothetical protein